MLMNVDSVMWSKWGQTKSDVLKPPKTKVFNNIERSFDSRQVHLGKSNEIPRLWALQTLKNCQIYYFRPFQIVLNRHDCGQKCGQK